jgi:hypothetical protein
VSGEGGPIAIPPPARCPAATSISLLTDTLAPPLQGVRDYMSAYPYGCFEQRTSRAIALGDMGEWQALVGAKCRPISMSDGLLRYFPIGRLRGSIELTSYMSITCRGERLRDPRRRRAKHDRGAQGRRRRASAARGYGVGYPPRPEGRGVRGAGAQQGASASLAMRGDRHDAAVDMADLARSPTTSRLSARCPGSERTRSARGGGGRAQTSGL